MEFLKEKEKKIYDVKINKNYLRVYSLINKISIANYHFSQKELINKKDKKRSYDFISKRINFNDIDIDKDIQFKIKRKYTKELISSIKGFVPQLKPIKNTIIPSKLLLNKKENKILKSSSKNFLSCPNSEEDEKVFDSSKENFPNCTKNNNNLSSNIIKEKKLKKTSIKDIRKNLIKIRNINSQKFSSDNNLLTLKSPEKKLNYDNSSGSDLNDEEYNSYLLLRKELTNKKENAKANNYRNRTNSMSILELLGKKFKNENE